MKRAITAPPTLAPTALAELKAWLGISTTREDAELTGLIRAALELCEGFIGAMPLASGCEEILPAIGEWQALATRPVLTISGILAISADGTRSALGVADYEIDIAADGTGRVRIASPLAQTRVAVSFTAGMAEGWDTLPDAIQQGLVRWAAHQHRTRDNDKAMAGTPASVAALWRPWRRMRIA
ncbi:hypothetical protein AQZ52_01320 [Novosphingobium fuchskuhlense]|uniref:PhiE125 gp8 family phage protein n=1 Tax=Novosphingobium fuchskuhlense TaxID=1117702 RepID=A0A124JWS4_9SPHN|nr:phage head-tail connector protein [Novosphingobium fuchskuhlense]KUR73638.1 hypothetical protein AQZ52_01320 [Novosphingobium fuchskuhlense]